uniref:Uncharacterized protein n=1 Tax=Romanomermis culicivorax TaxID=13658 RepID=A0A915HI22_ROMCU
MNLFMAKHCFSSNRTIRLSSRFHNAYFVKEYFASSKYTLRAQKSTGRFHQRDLRPCYTSPAGAGLLRRSAKGRRRLQVFAAILHPVTNLTDS